MRPWKEGAPRSRRGVIVVAEIAIKPFRTVRRNTTVSLLRSALTGESLGEPSPYDPYV